MPKKMDTQELEELRELESKSQELRDELAEVVIREENVKTQIEQLQSRLDDIRARKDEVFEDIREIDSKGSKFARNLRQKYGEGQFNLETGEFIEKTSEER
jgi:predicted  nucleic acid-binding Zn-ribbon protein